MSYVIILNGRPLDDEEGKPIEYERELEAESMLGVAQMVAPNIFNNATVEEVR